jgi:hypothetical protein
MMEPVDVQTREPSIFARSIKLIFGVLIAVFAVGVLVGFTKATLDGGEVHWKGIVIIAVLVPGLLFAAYRLIRSGGDGEWLPRTPRRRSNRIVLYASLAFGALAGVLMQLGEDKGHPAAGEFMSYDAPLNPTVALVLLTGLPLLGWLYYRWHQSADEHDLAAYNFGGMLSLYAYFFASIGWWIAWRGGFMPEPDGFSVFWLVIVVWSLGWMWKKFR